MKKILILLTIFLLFSGCNKKENIITYYATYNNTTLTGNIYDQNINEQNGIYYLGVAFSYYEYILDLVYSYDESLFGLYFLNNNLNTFVEVDYHILKMIEWQINLTSKLNENIIINEKDNTIMIFEPIDLDIIKYHYAFYVMKEILLDFEVNDSLISTSNQVITTGNRKYNIQILINDLKTDKITVNGDQYLYRFETNDNIIILIDNDLEFLLNIYFNLINNKDNINEILNKSKINDFYIYEK